MSAVISKYNWKVLPLKKDNEDNPFGSNIRVLNLSKRITEGDPKANVLIQDLSTVDGIEAVKIQGGYTVLVIFGACFDVEMVQKEASEVVERFLSNIDLPSTSRSKVKIVK